MTLLWWGVLISFLLGVAHAVYVFRAVAAAPQPRAVAGLYYASWTLLLWLILGGYVVVMWLVGGVLYLILAARRP